MSIFITFEGPEGCGKTTISKKITEILRNEGYRVVYTREPGGIDIAEQIRNVILDVKNTNMDARTEALLYAASRRQHLIEKVIPALNRKEIVICDRFLDSSLAYQGYARDLGIDEVFEVNKFAIEDTIPNLTILFDLEPLVGLERINQNTLREINRLDQEPLDFHNKVREGYLKVQEKDPQRIKIINANQKIEDVLNDTYLLVMDIIKNNYEK